MSAIRALPLLEAPGASASRAASNAVRLAKAPPGTKDPSAPRGYAKSLLNLDIRSRSMAVAIGDISQTARLWFIAATTDSAKAAAGIGAATCWATNLGCDK